MALELLGYKTGKGVGVNSPTPESEKRRSGAGRGPKAVSIKQKAASGLYESLRSRTGWMMNRES